MYKKLSACLIALLLVAQPLLLAASATAEKAPRQMQQFTSNRYIQADDRGRAVPNANASVTDFDRVAENEHLILYVHPQSLAIKVKNKHTGYVWSSTIDQMENYRLNQSWKDFVDSAITIDYLNRQGKQMRESLISNGSDVKIEPQPNGFIADIEFMQANIKMRLSVELTESDVVVKIPAAHIQESKHTKLVSLQIYPFLGATFEDAVPGYMFIPDGSGALIRYDYEVAMESPYTASVYGHDAGYVAPPNETDLNPEFSASMPVYGVVHGVKQDAFLAIIESGDMYSQIMAYKAGLSTDFNWITTKFNYRYAYKQPTSRSNQSGTAIDAYQAEANRFDIGLQFKVVHGDDADYVGLAHSYQAYLKDRGVLTEKQGTNPLLRLEFLGAEMKEGLLWNSVVSMTPFDALPGFADELKQEGVEDFFFIYKGWYKNGLNGSLLKKFPFEKKLGGKSEIRDMTEDLEQQAVQVYFHTDYLKSLQGSAGLFNSIEYAKQINSRTIQAMRNELGYYYVPPKDALELAKQHADKYKDYGMERLAVDSISSQVFSVFNKGKQATREQNKDLSLETINVLGGGHADKVALYQPNAYAWGTTDKYLDAPLSSSGYLYVSDTVPFLQIVLKGYVDLYSPFMNFSSNQKEELLKLIDYGTYPSFYLTKESSHLLAKTPSRHIYTSEFSTWKNEIVHQYGVIQDSLGQVRDASIVSRDVLSPGVVAITYSNQTTFIVNYTDYPFTHHNITVEAKDFAILKGDQYRDPVNQ